MSSEEVRRATRDKRLQKELKDMASKESLYSIGIEGDDISKWHAIIQGPDDTPYAGGIFNIHIEFPIDFPFEPPKVTFKTPVYHPNISSEGSICFNIFKKDWTPVFTVEKVLMSLTSLLADPNPYDPLEPEIARLFKEQRPQFDERARKWTALHAG